ncbi:PIG-L family deacetylase [Arenibacter sp. BSSL-BM3]|uniref:PIG-L family deacetylase n=1 Tax=Arenibacter arenosicollis TaxID=2762274 RepID=A0ABR7QMQ1_9FLAO|nr:PIG-L family deacetylase [Arenibacter arenosicollis]MBC8768446.1 PIG-L family deacetylase [Arenibacter arenosicollis]
MRLHWVFFLGILLSCNPIFAQAPRKNTSSDIYHDIQKLNFLGTALYIAAHPDDENTRLISYLSNEVKAKTAYLSLTRGDGGQNLIGSELRELLGVLRTQELLAARRIDGGEQFFSRANDFGYSKHPKETLKIWNKEAVLSDVIWIIRNYKPDVIINRFDHRSPGSTHGHHTSSAMLSYEAFDLANNPNIFPEQLTTTDVWQPKRLFFNTSWWFYGSEDKFQKADKSKMIGLDVGVYYPLRGVSNNEIASLASSQHLCQGFGRLTTRGSENEYIELLKGDLPKDKSNIFDGINTTWSRVEGGEAVGKILLEIEQNFDFTQPSKHLSKLIEAYKALLKINDEHWKTIKKKELEDIIQSVCGLYLEATTTESHTYPGSHISVNIEALNRSSANINLKTVSLTNDNQLVKNIILKENKKELIKIDLEVPANTSYTSPYWLNNKGTMGMYKVTDQNLIGKPETPNAFEVTIEIEFNGFPIKIKKSVVYKYSKPEKGEIYQPFEILPEATANFKDKVVIFATSEPKEIPVTIKALKDNVKGELQLCFGKGWKVDQEIKSFEIEKNGDQQTLHFLVTPPSYEDENFISPIIKINGKEISKELIEISYDHIPKQSVLLPSETKVVRLNINKTGENIGYIVGAGDEIPESLEQIGYKVVKIDPISIQAGSLNKFDAIVVGIRAYNVVEELKFKQRYLLDYVKEGGNLIIQYNTAGRNGLDMDNLAPYPISLSRDRVTDETSNVKILANSHAVVNYPNKITQNDFNGWVQERGLYFPDQWSKEFTPILSMSDEGESALNGSLLVAPYGKGNYIYTGLSFFRELPAGVTGAYRLFANLLSLKQESQK